MRQRNDDLIDTGNNPDEWLFEIVTPLGFSVHTTRRYWDFITSVKHPVLKGRIDLVIQTLKEPDEIRRSRSDRNVFLFYHECGGFPWVCAVVKETGETAF